MFSTIIAVSDIIKNVSWEGRINRCIADPARALIGQETSSQAIARGLKEGHNAVKYKMVMDDLELMYQENLQHPQVH